MDEPPPADHLTVVDVAAWRAWLDVHEGSSDGVRLVLAKKGVTEPTSLTYAEALEEALCSGWIDGRRNGLDERAFLQHFTPRRQASVWSARNVVLVRELGEAGRMRPRGLVEVERAKADGRWGRAYAGQAGAEVPDDLALRLAASAVAAERFAALTRAQRYSIIHPVITAATPATRQRRIEKLVTRLEESSTP